jgi:hypothetical protein
MTAFFSSDDEIDRIGIGLLDRSLPEPEWTHAGHFAAALWLLRHKPHLVERGGVGAIIRAYNEATGTANTDNSGYHETITMASMRAAAAFLATHGEDAPLHLIANDLLASACGDPNWLLDYWSRCALFSAAARREWLEPDVAPLPY